MRRRVRREFTPEEDRWLVDNYATCGVAEAEQLWGRSWVSLKNRARKLDLSRPRPPAGGRAWAAEEDAQVERWARSGATLDYAAEQLDRTVSAVQNRCERLRVRMSRRPTAHCEAVLERRAAEYHSVPCPGGFMRVSFYRQLVRWQHAWAR